MIFHPLVLGKQMFKKLMVACFGLTLGLSVIGCGGDGEVTKPEDTAPPPAEKPAEASMTIEAE